MATILRPPECEVRFAEYDDDIAYSMVQNYTDFDRGNIDNLCGQPLIPTSASERLSSFPSSLASSSSNVQCGDYTFQPYILPEYSLTFEKSIFEKSCALFDLRQDLDCSHPQENSVFDEGACTPPLNFELSSPSTSHNNCDSMPAVVGSVISPEGTHIAAPYPAQAPDASSAGMSLKYFDTDDQRWHATQSRSRVADRSFLYGVLTTRIFCRPSCPSRRPSRRHVRFFPFPGAIEAAEQAKLRPCKRCIPKASGVETSGIPKIYRVLRMIIAETFGKGTRCGKEALKMDSLAKLASLSTFHFHRTFKAKTQMTPGDFIHACRALALQDALRNDSRSDSCMVADALAVIENSSCWNSRTAKKALGGISPAEFLSNTSSILFEYCCAETRYGRLCVVFSAKEHCSETKLHATFFAQERESLCLRFPTAKLSGKYEHRLQQCVNELGRAAKDWDIELPADVLPVLWRARIWLSFLRD